MFCYPLIISRPETGYKVLLPGHSLLSRNAGITPDLTPGVSGLVLDGLQSIFAI